MSILSGLKGLGLGNLENMEIFEEKKEEVKAKSAEPVKVQEKELILDKTFQCPVCDNNFTAKIMKSGRAKLIGTEADLRAKYDGIDAVKYDVLLCPTCGYAALSRYFPSVMSAQAKLIRENISMNVHVTKYDDEIYTYEEAIERYKLALVNAVVKRAKASEKAYICLKSGWLMRGYAEYLKEQGKTNEKVIADLEKQENEYLENAYKGFAEARQSESFPMCGMDEVTVDYLLAVLATRFKHYDVAGKLVSGILANSLASARVKEKTRDLKEQILEELKKK